MSKHIKGLTLLPILLLCAGCAISDFIPTESQQASNVNQSEKGSNEENKSQEQLSEVESVSQSETGAIQFDTSKKVSIKFYHTMNNNLCSVADEAIGRFNKIYPNINVESVSAGGYEDVRDQLKTSLSADAAVCDMAYCYPDHIALYNQAKSVVALDRYIEDETYGLTQEQIDDFVESYWNEGKSFGDGLMYCLPFSKSSEALYYNKDVFTRLNLKVPTHWFKDDAGQDEDTSIEYACEKILEAYPTSYPLGYDSESNWFITLCEQLESPYTSSGVNHYLFDNEVNRGFVKRLKGWYDKHYFTTKALESQYTSNLFKNMDQSKHTCYMCIGSTAGASNQRPDGFAFDVGVAKVPQANPQNGKVISQGPSVCIFKNKDPQKEIACWLLLRFLTTDVPFQGLFSMTSGYSPVIKSVYSDANYQEFLDNADGGEYLMASSTIVARDEEEWYFTSPAFIGSADARDSVGSMLVSIFANNDPDIDKTVADAFTQTISMLKGD